MKHTTNKVLVIVAHSDDEAIGCGGTLLKHRDASDEIRIIYMTNGVGARNADTLDIDIRLKAQKSACRQLEISEYYNFDFPDNKMDTVPLIDVAQAIESVLTQYQANIIYTHHGGDLNIDHRITHQAVMTACRPQPNSSILKILTFEVNSSTEWSSLTMTAAFSPNYFVDISNYQQEKKEFLRHYEKEMRGYPHSRSYKAITNLNNLRGNQVGLDAAEAFMLIREIRA